MQATYKPRTAVFEADHEIDLPGGLELGLLGQAAFVDKETTNTAPPSTPARPGTRIWFFSRTPSHLRRTLGLWIWRAPSCLPLRRFARKRQVGGYARVLACVFIYQNQSGNLFCAGLALG